MLIKKAKEAAVSSLPGFIVTKRASLVVAFLSRRADAGLFIPGPSTFLGAKSKPAETERPDKAITIVASKVFLINPPFYFAFHKTTSSPP